MSKKWALMVLALVVAVAILFSGCIDIEWPSRYKELSPHIVSDGSGGVFIGWEDENVAYAQRVDSEGNLRWGSGLVLNTTRVWGSPYVVRDDSGGAIFVWGEAEEKDGGAYERTNYAQRVGPEGESLWDQGGKPVPGLGCVRNVVPDGSGGAIIASGGSKLKMQRIDHEGKPMWSEEGITICTTLTSGSGNEPRILADGSGGAIIVWPDNRAAYGRYDIYAQRISPEGEILWQEGGIPVCAPQHGQTTPQIVSDGSDGAIVAWLGGGVRVQRLSPYGEVLWQEEGVQVNVLPSQGTYPLGMISDGAGGAIVVWHPSLSPALEGSLRGLRAQRVNSGGEVQWAEPAKLFVGLNVCAWEGVYSSMTAGIIGDGSGGAIIVGIFCVWGPSPNAQRVNLDGEPLWGEGGVELFSDPQAKFSLFQGPVVSDGSGGAIFVTETGKKETYLDRIYAQRIDSQGELLWTDEGALVWPR
jgi:hypothetical protein